MGILKSWTKEWPNISPKKKSQKESKPNRLVRYQNSLVNFLKRKFFKDKVLDCPNVKDEPEESQEDAETAEENSMLIHGFPGIPNLSENEFESFTKEKNIYGGFSCYMNSKWFRKNVLMKSLREEMNQKFFQRELNFLSEVRHPNIISLLGISKIQKESYLIFENFNFDSLFNQIHKKQLKLNLKSIKSIGIQICETFMFLHDKNWVHRNLNSYNLFINNQMTLKVTGFEFAQQVNQDAQNNEDKITVPLDFYNWLAPEQLFDTSVHKAIDIYSVSLVIWELFLGSIPWKGVSYDHLMAHYQQTECTLTIKDEYFPKNIGPILRRGLEYHVIKRDVHFHEIIEALTNCIHLEPKNTINKECNTTRVYQLNSIETNEIAIVKTPIRTKSDHGTIKKQEVCRKNKIFNINETEKDEECDSYTGLTRVTSNNKHGSNYFHSITNPPNNDSLTRSKQNLNLKNLECHRAIKPASHSLVADPTIMYDGSKFISPNKNLNNNYSRSIQNSINTSSISLSKNVNPVSSRQLKYESIEHLFIDDDNYDNDPNTKLMGSDNKEVEEQISYEGNLFNELGQKLPFEDLMCEEKLDTDVMYNRSPLKRGMNWYSFYFTELDEVTEL